MTAFRLILGCLFVICAASHSAAEDFAFFEKKIRPVLVEKCYACHAAQAPKIKGGFQLDSREAIRKGGDTGPAVVPGKPDESLILKALRYEKPQMPPGGKLPANVIADFEAWIKAGAVDPREKSASPEGRTIDLAAAKQFWSFQQPKPHPAPTVRNAAWPIRKIDSFILAKLEAARLEPAPVAEPRTLIRRLYFDLIGLPPTPEQVDEFAEKYKATPQAAIAQLVERLLGSPQYGERWARLWLDIARYAEDQAHIVGADASLTYPNAYLYRDWVIAALNNDMPYDRFVKLQLAADLIAPKESAQIAQLAALGYLGLGPKYYNRKRLDVMTDEWEDRIDVVGRGMLGLTLACARCHDHKFDPVPTADYYALAGVFASTAMFNKPLNDKVAKRDKSDEAKSPRDAMHIVKEGTPADLNVFVRGNVEVKGPLVKRRFLQVLCLGEAKPFEKGSGRQELAEAIADAKNPLTARVIVNRIWAAHFGTGIVATTSNFGTQGDPPSHRELLDDLAVRFVKNGWSLKWLHREIVLSATYRQSSGYSFNPQSEKSPSRNLRLVDADNRLLSRMPRQRLSVEAWRDAMLAATGTLDSKVGGPSLDPLDPKQHRRTLYSAVSRLELNRLLALFDFPDANIHAGRRVETTTPLQKLFVLNSPFMIAQAEALSGRLQREITGTDPDVDRRRIDRAYLLLYSRPAGDKEIAIGLKFLASEGARMTKWNHYAHALLASNEMMYVD